MDRFRVKRIFGRAKARKLEQNHTFATTQIIQDSEAEAIQLITKSEILKKVVDSG